MNKKIERRIDEEFADRCPIGQLVFENIKWEHTSQFQKWNIQSHKLNDWLNFLMEEVGELAKAISDYNYRGGPIADIYRESIQVSALGSKIADMSRSRLIRNPKPKKETRSE